MLVKLEAYHDGENWCARGIGESVFTQGKTFEKLLANVREALALHLEEKLEAGETLQVLILTEAQSPNKKSQRKPDTLSFQIPADEVQRRKALVKSMVKLREELPPLDMTTAELVRQERGWYVQDSSQ